MLKTTYKPQRKLEVFFTGGPARLSRDGKLLACPCGEEVKLVDVATGSVVRSLPGDTEPVSSLAWSPDCQTLVVSSRSCTCRVYDAASGELRRSWRAHKAPVHDVAVDASGGYVATAGADRLIKVWDLQAGFCTHSLLGHSGVVLRVLFHPTQLLLFSAGDDGEVRVWDLGAKRCIAHLQAHFSAVTSLALSPDGRQLLSGGRDKVVVVWDVASHAKLATIPVYEALEGLAALPPGVPFPGVSVGAGSAPQGSPTPVYFATCGDKGAVKLWQSDTGRCVYEHSQGSGRAAAAGAPLSASQQLTDLALLPGGKGLLATTADARLLFLQPAPGGKGAPRLELAKQLVGNVDEVTDVRLVGGTAQQPTHVAVATNCEVIQVFDCETLSCTASCEGHADTVLALDATFNCRPNGEGLLVSGGKDNEVRVWAMPTGRCLARGVGHVGSVGTVALSRKAAGKFFASAGADKLIKVWDLSEMLTSLAEAEAAVAEAAAAAQQDIGVSVDGPDKKKRKVGKAKGGSTAGPAADGLSGTQAEIPVIPLRAMAAIAAHDKDINSVAVSPNDQLLASGSQDRTAKVWKLPSLAPVAVLRGHKRGVWCVEFSPVDQALLTASGDKTIKLWSLADGGACLRTFEGSVGTVLRATFLTAGTQVLSCGADGLVKLWSMRTGECTATFDEHSGKIWAMATGGGDERLLVTGGADACVALWADVTASEASAAEEAEEQLVQKEQQLANALAAADYVSAARLAFDLKHPGRLLTVVQRAASMQAMQASALLKPAAGANPQQQQSVAQRVQTVLAGLARHLTDADVKTALEYCREWNTNSRHCHAAQAMLSALLQHKKPAQLLALPGLADLVAGLLAYSQRHVARVDRLLKSTYLLDYTLASLQVLHPMAEEEAADGEQAAGTTSGSGHMVGITVSASAQAAAGLPSRQAVRQAGGGPSQLTAAAAATQQAFFNSLDDPVLYHGVQEPALPEQGPVAAAPSRHASGKAAASALPGTPSTHPVAGVLEALDAELATPGPSPGPQAARVASSPTWARLNSASRELDLFGELDAELEGEFEGEDDDVDGEDADDDMEDGDDDEEEGEEEEGQDDSSDSLEGTGLSADGFLASTSSDDSDGGPAHAGPEVRPRGDAGLHPVSGNGYALPVGASGPESTPPARTQPKGQAPASRGGKPAAASASTPAAPSPTPSRQQHQAPASSAATHTPPGAGSRGASGRAGRATPAHTVSSTGPGSQPAPSPQGVPVNGGTPLTGRAPRQGLSKKVTPHGGSAAPAAGSPARGSGVQSAGPKGPHGRAAQQGLTPPRKRSQSGKR